jgi:hypothetical protein
MCVVEIAARKRLEKPPALVTPVSVEVSEGTEAIVVEEDGEVSSVSSRVLAPAVRVWLWHVGARSSERPSVFFFQQRDHMIDVTRESCAGV